MSELRGDFQELSPTAQRNETERRIRKARFDKLRALRLCKLMSEVKSMVQRLSHVTIHVLDQDSAYDFYINKLGFEVRTDSKMDNGFRWLTVGPKTQPDLEIVLMPTGAGPMMDEETSTMLRTLIRKGALGSGVLETADCQKTYEELTRRGVEFKSPPTERFYGIEALFKDDSGNWFSLTERKGAKTAEV